MKRQIIVVIFILVFSQKSLSQRIVNGDFNYTCFDVVTQYYSNAFYNAANCGLSPWQVSHGTPDIGITFGAIPEAFSAKVYSGKINNPPGYFSEGIFQNYTFIKGNRYYLRAYVSADHPFDGGAEDVDKVFIAITNGLTGKSYPTQESANFDLPSVARQDVWHQENYKTNNQWVLINVDFVANDNYSQLWISLKDNDGSGEEGSIGIAKFEIAGLFISCYPYDQSFVNFLQSPILHLPANVAAGDKIETEGLFNVGMGENVKLQAGKEIGLGAGFVVTDGGLFTAQIKDYCDCSVDGGIVQNICDVFSGGILYIPNSQGPGVYVPKYFNRDSYANWYPSSYGYTKPYNAYYWNLKIIDRWGLSVYEANGTTGVDGFANRSITWNGGNVSAGTYYVQLDLTNCSGTYTYNNWLQVDGTPHPNSSSIISDTKPNPSVRMATNSESNKLAVVEKTALYDIYPNPSNRQVTFKFSIASPGHVDLVLYDELGAVKKVIISEDDFPSGLFEFGYSVESLIEGVYICSLQTKDYHETKKIVVIK